MDEVKITVKNVKTFRGHEGIGVNADVYINGKFVGYALDDANGGELDFQPMFSDKTKDSIRGLIKSAEEFAKSQPKKDINPERLYGKGAMMVQPTFESLIDDAINEVLGKREDAAKLKKMQKGIMFGRKGAGTYSIITWKGRTLKDLPLGVLQLHVDKVKKDFRDGDVFLNADVLTSLGVKL